MVSIDWVSLIIGAILSVLLSIVIEAFLPVDIKFHLHYAKKWVFKQFSRPNVQVGITIKTPDISDQQLTPEKVAEHLRQVVILHNLQPTVTQDEIHFQFEVGATRADCILRMMIVPASESLFVSQIEAQVLGMAGYHDFIKDVHELTEATHIVEDYLREYVPAPLTELILECKLKSLYELTGVLSEYHIEQLSATMKNDGYRFDFVKDGIIVYAQRVIESKMIVFLRRLITFYY